MKIKELDYLIKSDLFRYNGNSNLTTFIKALLNNGGFQLTFFFRICNYCLQNNHTILLIIFKIFLKITCLIYNSEIHCSTKIGSGLYLSHCSGIVISSYAVIGNNVNISQQVTIGISGRGTKRGVPIIGNSVYIGPGAKLFGKICIGNNVAIGANAVVTKDIPDDSVAVGVPAKIISHEGCKDYVLNTDYYSDKGY